MGAEALVSHDTTHAGNSGEESGGGLGTLKYGRRSQARSSLRSELMVRILDGVNSQMDKIMDEVRAPDSPPPVSRLSGAGLLPPPRARPIPAHPPTDPRSSADRSPLIRPLVCLQDVLIKAGEKNTRVRGRSGCAYSCRDP